MWSVGCGYKTMKKLNYHTVRVRFQLLVIFTVLSGTKGQTELSDCRVDIDTDWTVRASCHYTKADVSRIDDINCTWYRQRNQGNVTLVTDGIVTSQLVTEGSKTYYRGNCSLSVTVSASQQGNHTFYIDFVPGPGRVETGHIQIEEPGKPESTCEGRTVFPQGQDRSCTCTNNKTQPGSPPPTVRWRGLPPGQPLLLRNIPRRPVESHWICEMRWGPEGNSIVKTTNISTVIVYGPDLVTISDGPLRLTGAQDLYEGQTAVWRCTAYSASISVGLTWTGVQCDINQTRRDCSFTAGRQDDGKTVTCTGTNIVFPDVLHASTSVKLNVKYPPPVAPEITGYTNNAELTEGDNLTLTCTVRGGNPPVSSVTFSCGSDHHDNPADTVVTSATRGQSSVTSTVTIPHPQSVENGTTCLCGAEWPYGPDTLAYTLTSSVTLRVTATGVAVMQPTLKPLILQQTTVPARAAGNTINVGAVAGGVVGAVIVVVAVVVVGVLVRRYMGRSIYAKPGPRSQESNYTDLELHGAVSDTRRAASYENTAANSDYENTGDSSTPGEAVQYQNTGSPSQTESVYENTSHE